MGDGQPFGWTVISCHQPRNRFKGSISFDPSLTVLQISSSVQ